MWTNIDLAEFLASAVIAPVLAWICIVDIREYRIPDHASLPLIALGLGASLWPVMATPADAVLGVMLGYGIFALIGAIHFRRTGRDGLGLGDAKLLGAAGAWLGWAELPLLIAFAAVSALAFAILTRQRRIAFGPWLAGAFWLLWIVKISA